VHRDTTVSDERLNEERVSHAKTAKERDTVGPRRTIVVTEPDGSSKTFRTGDKISRGPGCIRSQADWEDLSRQKDLLCLTESQWSINNDRPESRYIIDPDGKAIITRRGIKSPREIVSVLDFARPPDPATRTTANGNTVEVGEWFPGSDGSEVFERLLSKGPVVDRKFTDKVRTAAKKVLSKTTKKASA
jgi:hypothetical protein